ncbi:MAG: FAD binding domain-containing protein [Flavobacteriales bacterium]|jgi:4-hydroxybenzoyl-CoA reductase subunit beta|nr:FAD binding domain-containing protein [Flavobacteriales bacterium]
MNTHTDSLYLRPLTAHEAVRMAGEHLNDHRYLAGGTDLLVNRFQGNDATPCLIDLSGIEALHQVTVTDQWLRIGALVRLNDLMTDPAVHAEFPGLQVAAHAVGSPMIRRTATLGGNLLCENRCSFYNQSEWWRDAVGRCLKCDGDICIATGGRKACFSKLSSDTAPMLIALDAQLEVAVPGDMITMPVRDLYTGDGMAPFALPPAALVQAVMLPLGRGFRTAFRKLRRREAVDFSSLTTAVSVDAAGKVRIVVGAVDPGPVVVEGTAADNRADLIRKAFKKARVIDNDTFPRTYRKEMITVFLERCFAEIDATTNN